MFCLPELVPYSNRNYTVCGGGVSLFSIHRLIVNHTIVEHRHTMTLLLVVKLSLRGSVCVHVQGVNVTDITFVSRCLIIANNYYCTYTTPNLSMKIGYCYSLGSMPSSIVLSATYSESNLALLVQISKWRML